MKKPAVGCNKVVGGDFKKLNCNTHAHTHTYLYIISYIYIYIYVHAKSEVDGPTLTWTHNLFVIRVFEFPTLGSSLYRDPMELSSPLNYLIPSLPIIIVLAWYTLALSTLSFFVNLSTPHFSL